MNMFNSHLVEKQLTILYNEVPKADLCLLTVLRSVWILTLNGVYELGFEWISHVNVNVEPEFLCI